MNKKAFKIGATAFAVSLLAACGGGGGSSTSSSGSTMSLGGSAVKGPLANALVEVYSINPSVDSLQGALIESGSTNAQAAFSGINLSLADAPFLLVVTADSDTVDITTGEAPVITSLSTIITQNALENGTPIYATPLTSMAVELASSKDDLNADNLQSQLISAQNQVKTTLGFGLDETIDIFTTAPLLTEETDTPEEQEATAEYRLAIEALSAVIVDIAEETSETDDTPVDVLAALAEDLSDGELDGMKSGETVSELDGYDVSMLDDVDLNTLTVPGTDIVVNDIEQVLNTDTETTNVNQTLDETIDVSAEPPVLVADVDLDGFRDDVDNCPVITNESQSDTNENGVGDVCDAAPVIAAALSATVDEDSSVAIDLSQSATDAEGDSLSYSVGALTLEGSSYLFTPEANENGAQILDYRVSDGTSTTAGVVNITITPQNDPGSVSISGDASQGQTLTATVIDAIDGLVNAIISYIWNDDSGVIEGETDRTLTLTQDQVGNTITVSASYTDDEGFQETVVSEATEAVEDLNDQPSGELSLSGVAREDETVSVNTDALSDPDGSIIVVTYQWISNGDPIDSATQAEFTIPAALIGTALSVEVSFTDSVFTNDVVTANASFDTLVANANDVATGTVTISNTSPAEGDGLVVSLENIQDEDGLTNVDYAYQWLADGEEISGATASTYMPGQQQVGSTLSVEVSFIDDFGSAESLTSTETSAVTNVNDDPMGSVSISGSAIVGQTLTASNNLIDEDGIGEITYQWFLNGVTTSVAGPSYTVQLTDVDGEITVVANYVDVFGEQESVESNAVTGLSEPVEFDTSLVGSWDFHIEEFGAYDKTILSLAATGEFFFFNVNSIDEDVCRENGYEYGTYERVGNNINLTRVIDSNGCVGIFDATEGQSEATFTITEEETTSITVSIFDPIDDPQGTNPDILTWTRILTNEDSIVGPWHEALDEGGENNLGNNLSNLVLFLGDGRFYTMDADPTNTSENDFGYGDHVADLDGNGLTLTFRFDGTGGETLGEEKNFANAAIVENELFINTIDDQYGIGRVVPDSANVNAPLAFTEAELDAGFTWFFPLLEPEDCGNQWVVEEMNFDATGYSLDVCGSGNGEEVDEAYSIQASGIVNLVAHAEYVKRMSFDPELQAYLVCWEDTELAASDCAEENQGYAFLSQADAQAYADDQEAAR